MKRLLRPLLLLAILGILLPTLPPGQGESSVQFVVQTDKDLYLPGEVVHVKLIGTNTGLEPVTYTFSDSCNGFFFEISDSSGALVFSTVPPPGVFCALIFTTITLQPGQTLTVAALDWNQRNMLGQQVSSGTYAIAGVFHYQNPYQTTPLASKLVAIVESSTFTFSHTVTFDGVTVTVSGTLTVETNAKTLTGTAAITAVNNTSGQTIFSKTFNIFVSFGSNSRVMFLLAIPSLPLTLAAECRVDVATHATRCMVSRTPDLNQNGIVDIFDAVQVGRAFDSRPGDSNYSSNVDLNADGAVGIFDTAILGQSFDAPVFA